MTAELKIRSASPADMDEIHRLSIQLGYSPTYEDLSKGLECMLQHSDYEVLVAVREDQILGWMSLCKRLSFLNASFLQVIGIVVDSASRGQGVGRCLLKYAEDRAKEKSLAFVGLYTNKRRTESHEFYRKSGYTPTKESFFFMKEPN